VICVCLCVYLYANYGLVAASPSLSGEDKGGREGRSEGGREGGRCK